MKTHVSFRTKENEIITVPISQLSLKYNTTTGGYWANDKIIVPHCYNRLLDAINNNGGISDALQDPTLGTGNKS